MSKVDWFPNDYISFSAMKAYEDCPMSFYLRYYCKVKWPQNDAMILGGKFQEALNAKYDGKDPLEIINELPEGDIQTTAIGLMGRANSFPDILSIDSPYIVDFGFDIPVKFIPDLVTKDRIIENKYTGGYYNKRMALKEKQGTLYYHGMYIQSGVHRPVSYQIFNKKNGKVELVDTPKTQDDVDELYSWMNYIISNIKENYKTGMWVGPHTKYKCNLGDACPNRY